MTDLDDGGGDGLMGVGRLCQSLSFVLTICERPHLSIEKEAAPGLGEGEVDV